MIYKKGISVITKWKISNALYILMDLCNHMLVEHSKLMDFLISLKIRILKAYVMCLALIIALF